MTLRVVLYAEGVADDGGRETDLPAPTEPLGDEHLGPAHVFARRVLETTPPVATSGLRFLSPLRVRSRRARGSDLRHPPTLRRLLAFPDACRRPDLAIVFVDQDGDGQVSAELRNRTQDLLLPRVIAVPVPEFEAWFLADEAAASAILRASIDTPSDPESHAPGEAKKRFNEWLALAAADAHRVERADLRQRIAERADLGRLRRLRSFEIFERECREVVRLCA